MFKKWLQRRREKRLRQLDFVQHQIFAVLSENDEFHKIAAKYAHESAGRPDETRKKRMQDRSKLQYNMGLLGWLNFEKTRLERKLKIVAT